MNRLLVLLSGAIAFVASGTTPVYDFKSNEIKQGYAEIYVDVIAEYVPLPMDSLTVGVFWTPLLDYNAVERVNKIVTPAFNWGNLIRVPMETLRRDGVNLTLYNTSDPYAAQTGKNNIISIGVGLNQESPLHLKLHFDSHGKFIKVEHSGGTGYVEAKQNNEILNNVTYNFTESTGEEEWKDYNRFLKWQNDSMVPTYIRTAFEGTDLPGELSEFIKIAPHV